jgi:hypothetical protein
MRERWKDFTARYLPLATVRNGSTAGRDWLGAVIVWDATASLIGWS